MSSFRWEAMTRAGPPEWGSVSDTLFPGSSSSPPAGPNSPPWTGETDGSQRDYITLTCINVPPGAVTLPLEVLGTTGIGQFAIATASNNGGALDWDTDGGATIPSGRPTELNVVQADGLVLPTVTHTGGELTLQVIVSPTGGGIPGTADIWWGQLEAPTWPTVLPVGPSSPPFTSTWTPGENIFDPPGALNLHIAWAPAGLYTVTIETTGTTAGVSGMVFDVLDPLGVRVPLVDAGGAVANLPIGYVATLGPPVNPIWDHAGGPIRLRMFGIGGGAGTATATWGDATATLPGDAAVPTGTPHEWDTAGGTTTQPPAYTPPTDLSGWHTDEAEGTTLVLEATGLTEGQEIVVPIRPQAGAVRVAMVSPANFRPALIDPGGAEPDPSGDGLRIVGPDLDAPRWRMVAAGDVQLTIELDDHNAARVITFAPWVEPSGGGGGGKRIARLLTQTATINARTQTGTDDFGAPTWATSTTDVPCKLDPRSADDTWPAELIGRTVGLLFLDADVTPPGLNDTITVDGTEWTPTGVAKPLHDRKGLHHYEIRVQTTEGGGT